MKKSLLHAVLRSDRIIGYMSKFNTRTLTEPVARCNTLTERLSCTERQPVKPEANITPESGTLMRGALRRALRRVRGMQLGWYRG